MTTNGSWKPAPEPGLEALGTLLEGLHERGMSVGVDDATRVAKAFAHAQDWPRERRVRALKALLARSDDERRLIDQLAQFLFVDAPREVPPHEPVPVPSLVPDAPPEPRTLTDGGRVVSRPSSSRRWAAVGAVVFALLVVVAVAVWMLGHNGSTVVQPQSATAVATQTDQAQPPPLLKSSFHPLCERQPDPAAKWRRRAVAMSLLFGFGALGWFVGLVRRDRRGHRQERNVTRVVASKGPRVYVFNVPESEPLCPVESALLRDAAFQLSAPRTEVSAAWIDVRGTIEDTVSHLGLLSLRFDRWREQAPVIVLEDVGDGMARWPLHGRQLVEELGRQGAEVTHYFFDREPGRIHKERWLNQAIELDHALSASPQASVIVVSDASGIEPARGGSRPWMGILSGCLWLHPAPEALWGRGARWLGARLRVAAMSPAGLLRLGAEGLRQRGALPPAWQPPETASGDALAVIGAWRGVLSQPRGTDESAFWLLCSGALLAQRAGLTVRLLTALREQLIDAPWDLTERIWSFPTLSVGHDGTIQIDLVLAEALIGVLRKEQPQLLQRVVDWAKELTTTTSRELESGSLAELTARVTCVRLDAESETRRGEALEDVRALRAEGFGEVISGYASDSERKAWKIRGLRRVRKPTIAQWGGATAATMLACCFVFSSVNDRISANLWPSVPKFTVLTPSGSMRVTDVLAAMSPAASTRPEVYLCDELWLDSKLEVRVNGEPKPSLVADRRLWDLGAVLAESVPQAGSRHVALEFGYQGAKRYRADFELSAPPKPNESMAAASNPPEQLKGPRMVQIPAGTFQMGSNDGDPDEKPVHPVNVASFWMDVTEVTVADYEACVQAKMAGDARGCEAAGIGESCNIGKAGREKHPINCVDWNEARAYCAWAGKRLPTEEEWEYAARGTDARVYPWGNEKPEDQLCWKRSDGTCPVGSFLKGKSPFGVLDMAGNVWEWTETKYCDSYAESKKCAEARVDRGGSWFSDYSSHVRAAYRGRDDATDRIYDLGFRCAR